MAKRKAHHQYEFPIGRGILLCHFCSQPYRDHRIGPCPEAPPGALLHKPTTTARERDR